MDGGCLSTCNVQEPSYAEHSSPHGSLVPQHFRNSEEETSSKLERRILDILDFFYYSEGGAWGLNTTVHVPILGCHHGPT